MEKGVAVILQEVLIEGCGRESFVLYFFGFLNGSKWVVIATVASWSLGVSPLE